LTFSSNFFRKTALQATPSWPSLVEFQMYVAAVPYGSCSEVVGITFYFLDFARRIYW
jgi:hypothetical protein